MEGKKISFGFMKTKKAEKPVVEEKKDYIECLEEKSIKVVGGETVEETKPLVIPMKPNTLVAAERLKEIAAKVESGLEEPDKEKTEEIKIDPVENETLDQMAVRELLQESKKDVKVENADLTVPVPSKPVIDGQKESTLEDYESVPIQDFGMAMLRGMGWTPGKDQAKYKLPELRPKGLGLGADKVIKENQKKNKSSNSKEEELSIVKGSYVKITSGKHSGYYGKVISLDEENGRVMVEITVKKETVSLSEFMMQPVTKTEFDKESKVINTNAYEEYKKHERSQNLKQLKTETKNFNDREASSSQSSKVSGDQREPKEENRRKDKDRSANGTKDNSRKERDRRASSEREERSSRRKKDKYKRDSSSSEDRNDRKKKDRYRRDSSEDRNRSKKDKKRYSSNESLSSVSESEKRKKKKSKKYDSSDSESERESRKKDKRDIDKKRKGKKKKRDRDRSPNYKKYRK